MIRWAIYEANNAGMRGMALASGVVKESDMRDEDGIFLQDEIAEKLTDKIEAGYGALIVTVNTDNQSRLPSPPKRKTPRRQPRIKQASTT